MKYFIIIQTIRLFARFCIQTIRTLNLVFVSALLYSTYVYAYFVYSAELLFMYVRMLYAYMYYFLAFMFAGVHQPGGILSCG